MKRWIFLILIILVLIGAYLLDKYNLLSWQPLTIIAAVLAAPIRFIYSIVSGGEKKVKKRHQELMEKEREYQRMLDMSASEQTEGIGRLQTEVDLLDQELEILRKKRELVKRKMEDLAISEKQKAGRTLFGD